MSRIVVLGAGIGGVPMAFELREKLGRKVDIDVVAESEWFQFVPSNPWVSVSWRKPEDVKVHLPPVFARLGIGFHACGAKQVRPEKMRCCSTTVARCLTTISSSPLGRTWPSTRSKASGRKPTRARSAIPTTRRLQRRPGRRSARLPGRWLLAPCKAPPASGRLMNML